MDNVQNGDVVRSFGFVFLFAFCLHIKKIHTYRTVTLPRVKLWSTLQQVSGIWKPW